MKKVTHPLAEHVREGLGIAPGFDIYMGPTDEIGGEKEIEECSDEELESDIATATSTIQKIRSDAERSGKAISARDNARIGQFSYHSANCERELKKRHPPQRRSAHAALPSNRAPQDVSSDESGNWPRAGIILPHNRANIGQALFGNGRSQFKNGDEFFRLVGAGISDPRIHLNIAQEGIGVDGGFTVPEEFFRGTIERALQASEFAIRCRIFPTPTAGLYIPMPDTFDHSLGTAGLNAQWSGEAHERTPQTMKWIASQVKVHKLMLLAEASNELLDDGVNFQSTLEEMMAADGALKLDAAIIDGSGVAQPLGFLNHASVIEVDPEASQAADTLLAENLINMNARLHPTCHRNAVWFLPMSMMGQLAFLKFPGSTTQPIPLFMPANGMADAPFGRILGKPVVFSELSPVLGDAGDVALVDLSRYALVIRKGAVIEFNPYERWNADTCTWRLKFRVGGQPLWKSVITPLRAGEPTLSWAVKLGARA